MPIRLSRRVGILTTQPEQAANHYQQWLGLPARVTDSGIQLEAGGLILSITAGEAAGVIPELLVDDLDHARADLRRRGFYEQNWGGPGQLNIVTDAFGTRWNVHLGEIPPPWPTLQESTTAVPAKIAILTDQPKNAATLYANALGQPATPSPAAWVIDCGPLRLLFESDLPQGAALCIDPHASGIDAAVTQKLFGRKSVAVDEFGAAWKRVPTTRIEHAVSFAET